MSAVKDVLSIVSAGYSRYQGEIDPRVYERLPCGKPEARPTVQADAPAEPLAPEPSRPRRARRREPNWFSKLERGHMYVVCLGCESRCALINPPGFQFMLTMAVPAGRVAFAHLKMIHPRELVRAKELLRPDEAAYCLAVSERHVRDMVDEGRLVRHPELPLRITAESVAAEMGRRMPA